MWISALCFPLWMVAQGFVHPGALHTQADFDRVKAKLEAGEEPWTSAYKKLLTSSHVDLNWKPNPTEKIVRGGRSPEEPDPDNYTNAYRDIHTAYQCALVWKITGEEAYAEKSIQILNAWAKTCKKVSGDPNACLAIGIYGYQFANVGELMRDYEGWNPEDFARFQTWMLNVFCDGAFRFLETHNGTQDDHYWSNWGLCNTLCALSVAVLCDDVYLYDAAMEHYKYYEDRRYGEALHHLVWKMFEDERGPFGFLGQMQESNRDQGHATMAVALAADLCAIGRNQGEDAYVHMDDRIAAGFEYVAAYNAGVDDLPNAPYTNASGTYPAMGSGSRGSVRSNWPRIVNYYENVRGVEVPYCREMMMKDDNGIDGGGGFYGGNSGGYDHLGFTTLMCSLDPLEDKALAPTILGGTLQYDNVSTTRTEVMNIPRGTTVKISVILPEDEMDTGKWSWDDDASCTGSERELVLDSSCMYRVRYVNSRGVESTRMYSLHVEGEGRVSSCTPFCKVEGVESSDTMVYVKKYGKLVLGLTYSGANVREWIWEKSTNGAKWSEMGNNSNLLELPSVASNAYYRVTLVHKSGARVSQAFRVEVAEVDPYIIYNGNKLYDGTSLALEKGSSFSLYAEPTSILGKSVNSTRIYKWVVGTDTVQCDTLTYHLDESGSKVADLNDTLQVFSMDTCFSCALVFHRISSTGAEARTVYHFDVPVYEVNVDDPSSDDSYYIQTVSGDSYLRNTDAQFVGYSEESDTDYLWRIRRLPSTYGSRYMFISRSNSSQHLSEEGRLTTASDYSKHSFNLWRKCTDEGLYAFQRSPSVSGGLLSLSSDGSSLSVVSEPCTGFPFRLVKKAEDGPEEVETVRSRNDDDAVLLQCRRDGRRMAVNTVESGILRIYSFSGQLLQTVRCGRGANIVLLPSDGAGWLMQFVGESGRCQGLKMR